MASIEDEVAIEEDLAAFLTDAAATPFVWGARDCMLFAADWILRRRGIDVAAEWRGAYATRLEGLMLLRSLGGFTACAENAAAAAGLAMVEAPAIGAIGLIVGRTEVDAGRVGIEPRAAVYDGGRWVGPALGGGIAGYVETLQAVIRIWEAP